MCRHFVFYTHHYTDHMSRICGAICRLFFLILVFYKMFPVNPEIMHPTKVRLIQEEKTVGKCLQLETMVPTA